jgi:hypothetical protein
MALALVYQAMQPRCIEVNFVVHAQQSFDEGEVRTLLLNVQQKLSLSLPLIGEPEWILLCLPSGHGPRYIMKYIYGGGLHDGYYPVDFSNACMKPGLVKWHALDLERAVAILVRKANSYSFLFRNGVWKQLCVENARTAASVVDSGGPSVDGTT